MKLLLGPHDDDIELFAAFTAIRERPLVVVCLDSYVQPARGFTHAAHSVRFVETLGAIQVLSPGSAIERPAIPDDLPPDEMEARLRAEVFRRYGPEHVWAPAVELGGHPHHNLVGRLAAETWPGKVTHYLTYTGKGKSTGGAEVRIEDGEWIARKLRALACHRSQMDLDPRMGCWPHFLRDQREFYER